MPPTVKVKSSDEATRLNREEAAQRVVGYFGNRLPDLPLLCFFDDEDWPEYKGPGMTANRGIYFHDPPWMNAPDYVRECAFTDGLPFTNLIYLHGSTCAGTMGLTMTFAHELQHFVQHSTALATWAANMVAFVTLRSLDMSSFKALGLRACDIPHEREARIVAKRAAEDLLGAEAVRQHVEAKIAERVTEQDAVDWDCILGLDVDAPYDLIGETLRFFPMLRGCRLELERALRSLQSDDVAFRQIDLNALLGSKA